MLHEIRNAASYSAPQAEDRVQTNESALIARFVDRVNAFGPLSHASPSIQARLLEEIKHIALNLDASAEKGSSLGYTRQVLYEQPDSWSLAAIILWPGQQTQPHDHGGWGCVVTVQGIERDRRFIRDATSRLVLTSERDYPPATGYLFESTDIHQPVGADPRVVTVALHFLVH